jgi:hypothetical protein
MVEPPLKPIYAGCLQREREHCFVGSLSELLFLKYTSLLWLDISLEDKRLKSEYLLHINMLLDNNARFCRQTVGKEVLERAAGIEPASPAWKAGVLPLHNARALPAYLFDALDGVKKPNVTASGWRHRERRYRRNAGRCTCCMSFAGSSC